MQSGGFSPRLSLYKQEYNSNGSKDWTWAPSSLCGPEQWTVIMWHLSQHHSRWDLSKGQPVRRDWSGSYDWCLGSRQQAGQYSLLSGESERRQGRLELQLGQCAGTERSCQLRPRAAITGHMPGKLKRSFGKGASSMRGEHNSQQLEAKSHGRVIGRNRVARPALLLLLLPTPHPADLLFQLFLGSWRISWPPFLSSLPTASLPGLGPLRVSVPCVSLSLAARLRLRFGARPVLTLRSRSAGAQPGGPAREPQELRADGLPRASKMGAVSAASEAPPLSCYSFLGEDLYLGNH